MDENIIGQLTWDGLNGECYPQDRVVAEAARIIADLKQGKSVGIGQTELVNEIRLAVRRGDLPPMPIYVNNKTLNINRYGRIDCWPKGFADLIEVQLYQLL